jgi:hypothetical protein
MAGIQMQKMNHRGNKLKLSRVEEYRNSLEAKGYSLYLNNYWTQIIFHIVGIFE